MSMNHNRPNPSSGERRKGLLFVVSAPSGTGKSTLCRAMMRTFPDLYFSVSYTTRPPRAGDENGRDYHFVSAGKFQAMVERGEFLEWAEIYGHRYGTPRAILQKVRQEGRDVILDIDGQGARQLREQKLEGIFIFILPPSLEELQRRLSRRRTEDKEALAERLKKARAEMEDARWYDYLIINDRLERAEEELKAILLAENCRRERRMGALEKLIGSA